MKKRVTMEMCKEAQEPIVLLDGRVAIGYFDYDGGGPYLVFDKPTTLSFDLAHYKGFKFFPGATITVGKVYSAWRDTFYIETPRTRFTQEMLADLKAPITVENEAGDIVKIIGKYDSAAGKEWAVLNRSSEVTGDMRDYDLLEFFDGVTITVGKPYNINTLADDERPLYLVEED